jgi:hypothetical protein
MPFYFASFLFGTTVASNLTVQSSVIVALVYSRVKTSLPGDVSLHSPTSPVACNKRLRVPTFPVFVPSLSW